MLLRLDIQKYQFQDIGVNNSGLNFCAGFEISILLEIFIIQVTPRRPPKIFIIQVTAKD